MAEEKKKEDKAEAPKEPSSARRMVDGTMVADQKGLEAARKAKLKG